jgi:colanic acid biosynthesis glycosyl transferase WcaI
MRVLVISQVYWPDTTAVSQILTDMLEALSTNNQVEVFTSRRNYEDPKIKFLGKEKKGGVSIFRIRNTGFGKKNKIFRLLDFITFNISMLVKLLNIKKKDYDVIIGLTAPPLLSYIGVLIAKIKNIKFIYWTMDMQPELSIVAGYIKKDSKNAKILQSLNDYILNKADKVIVLDRYMATHVQKRTNTDNKKIEVIPLWPVMDKVYAGDRLDNPFRLNNGFGDKFVIMYSGNHSVMHPISTLLDTALQLKENEDFLFVHIGGGIRLMEVIEFKKTNNLSNITILPHQPRELIHLSIGSSDIQVVTMGEGCVGFTHPCKIYGALFVAKPILYIGPENSHITDILNHCPGNISIRHNDSRRLREALIEFRNLSNDIRKEIGRRNREYALSNFHPDHLISKTIKVVENINS